MVDTDSPAYDVIFMDVEMPNMNGYDTAGAIIDFLKDYE